MDEARGDSRFRLAVVSTPRSGNTWMRGMLSRLYGLVEMSAHEPEQVAWDDLPPRCVLQIHWWRVEPFLSLIHRHGFRVVVLARHPFDVFLSALNYTQFIHSPTDCGEGPGCVTCHILGATPRAEAFLDYACGWTGARLLSYTRDWWTAFEAHPVRYEDLVSDPSEALASLVASIAEPIRRPISEAITDYDFDRLRTMPDAWQYHFWQARPGHWKALLPAAEARRIASAHATAFTELGYACDPDESLDGTQADLNWYPLQLATFRRHLADERAKHDSTRRALAEAREAIASRERSLAEARAELDAARARLAPPEDLGPSAIGIARGLHRITRRHPSLTSALRRISGGPHFDPPG